MNITRQKKAIVVKFQAGADNRSCEYEMPAGTAREIINIDVTNGGGLRRRNGINRRDAMACHSLFTPSHGRFMLLWRSGYLTRMDADQSFSALAALQDASIAYAEMGGDVYWSVAERTGRVTAAGLASPWGLPVPPSIVATASPAGGLVAGIYQVTQTAVLNGLESGAPEPTEIEVEEGGGITITAPTASGVVFAVYVSAPNGGIHEMNAAFVANPGETAVIGSGARGRPLRSLFAGPPPAGSTLLAYRGRVWIARGNTLWFTDAQSPHWVYLDSGYFQFPGIVRMLAAVEDGIFVGSDDGAYFLAGADPSTMVLRKIDGTRGSGMAMPLQIDAFSNEAGQQSMWVDDSGCLAIGRAGGMVIFPGKSRFVAGSAGRYICYRETGGLRQILAALDDAGDSGLVADET